jgi:hypothetical protein
MLEEWHMPEPLNGLGSGEEIGVGLRGKGSADHRISERHPTADTSDAKKARHFHWTDRTTPRKRSRKCANK